MHLFLTLPRSHLTIAICRKQDKLPPEQLGLVICVSALLEWRGNTPKLLICSLAKAVGCGPWLLAGCVC